MQNLEAILQKLARARAEFLEAAERIPGPRWLYETKAGRWSAGGVVGHLSDVECGVRGYAGRVIRRAAMPVPFYRRLHFPLRLVESRLLKRQVPAMVTSVSQLAGKDEMLAGLGGVRERTLEFLEETRHRDLSAYSWRHPFLGRLNFYAWFAFLGAHEVRHSKQMWEIGQNLRKDVASSRKQEG